jgi:hypothetical protein
VQNRGAFVVNLWWDAGRSVVIDGRFSGVEKHANFLKFIFAGRGSVSLRTKCGDPSPSANAQGQDDNFSKDF